MRQSAEIEQSVEETVPASVPIEQTEEKENGTESTEETKTTEEVNEESDVFDEFNVSDVLREQQLQQANEYLSLLLLHRIGRERRRVLTNSSSSSSTCWEE